MKYKISDEYYLEFHKAFIALDESGILEESFIVCFVNQSSGWEEWWNPIVNNNNQFSLGKSTNQIPTEYHPIVFKYLKLFMFS